MKIVLVNTGKNDRRLFSDRITYGARIASGDGRGGLNLQRKRFSEKKKCPTLVLLVCLLHFGSLELFVTPGHYKRLGNRCVVSGGPRADRVLRMGLHKSREREAIIFP